MAEMMTDRGPAPIGLWAPSRILAPRGYVSCQPAREGGMCSCDEPDDEPLWPPSASYLAGGFLPVAVPADDRD